MLALSDISEGPLIGIVAGLAAAACWAAASLVFSQVPVSAGALNQFKNTVATLLLAATLLLLGASAQVLHAPLHSWIWLGLSGVLGITVGDTVYFRSLQILGPRRGLILMTAVPPLAGVLGWLVLGESLEVMQIAGVTVTLCGIIVVIRERGATSESAGHYPGRVSLGVGLGLLAALAQATGGLAFKVGVGDVETTLAATFIRLIVAVLTGAFVATLRRRWTRWYHELESANMWPRLAAASFIGTYLGIWFSLSAYARAPLGVATTLTSMTPIFVLPLVWWVLRQRISSRALAGALVAVVGVALLFGNRWLQS